jgi:hypothetical protein
MAPSLADRSATSKRKHSRSPSPTPAYPCQSDNAGHLDMEALRGLGADEFNAVCRSHPLVHVFVDRVHQTAVHLEHLV